MGKERKSIGGLIENYIIKHIVFIIFPIAIPLLLKVIIAILYTKEVNMGLGIIESFLSFGLTATIVNLFEFKTKSINFNSIDKFVAVSIIILFTSLQSAIIRNDLDIVKISDISNLNFLVCIFGVLFLIHFLFQIYISYHETPKKGGRF